MHITNEAYVFIVFVLNGILIGIIFDLFRSLRKTFKTTYLFITIEDILFWLISRFFNIIFFI